MNKFLSLIFILALFSSFSFAQQPSGTWVMAHIKAKQPVLSATMEQGELVFDEGDPKDSSEVYTPGLMVVQFEPDNKAKSFSWEGNENWRWSLEDDSLLMFGKRDTLYGNYSAEQIVLSSTLDNVPTQYTFLSIEDNLELQPIKPGTKGKISISDHVLNGLELAFERDTVIASSNSVQGLELYLTTIGSLQVIEYALDKENDKVELGIIYLFMENRRKYKGLIYPVIDDFRRPKELELVLELQR